MAQPAKAFSIAAIIICVVASVAMSATWYVSERGNDLAAGTNWPTAKASLQAAVDIAETNDVVLVSNGVYAAAGRTPPGQILCKVCVVVDRALTLMSVNGPSNTFIVGQGPLGDFAVRCAWLTNGAVLSGFSLTNGFTTAVGHDFPADESGGGVYCQSTNVLVTNCILMATRPR